MTYICDFCNKEVAAKDAIQIAAKTLGLKSTIRSDGALFFHKDCASVLQFKKRRRCSPENRFIGKADAKQRYFDPEERAELFEPA